MTWPAGSPATLSVDPAGSSLELPVRPVETQPQDLPMRSHDGTAKHPPPALTPVEGDGDGGYVYTREAPPWCYDDAEVGTTLRGISSAVGHFNPHSGICHWRHEVRRGWERGNWHCEVAATCESWTSADMLHIRETLRAYQDAELIFERTHHASIPAEIAAGPRMASPATD
jgi:hypothetical protein